MKRFCVSCNNFACIPVQVPPLESLYLNEDVEDAANLAETKWKLLEWIMELPVDVVDAIKELPNDYKLISTILYELVKVKHDPKAGIQKERTLFD